MNISQLISSSTPNGQTNGQTSTQAASGASAVSKQMSKADARIQSQLDSNTTQLSSFGKLKSSVSDVQMASRVLSGFTKATSAGQIKAAASRFAVSFNAAMGMAKSTATVGFGSGPNAESRSAARVSSTLGRAVTADVRTGDALKKMGFKQLSDGTLTIDSAKFDAALKADPGSVQETLSKIGKLIERKTTEELAEGGHVSGSMASLSERSATLKAQQHAIRAMDQRLSNAYKTAS